MSGPSERRAEGRAGSRRIFPPQFKLQVLEAYRRDPQCRGNQRATARKFGIHRRQIQKWLQAEPSLRAALLRRAPQPAPSPPPYSAGSPESARQPSPSPPVISVTVSSPTPQPLTHLQVQPAAVVAEPIDLSLKRPCVEPCRTEPPPPLPPSQRSPEPSRKPFKLFRPYLLEERRPTRPSAFSPVATGCAMTAAACPPACWYSPAFPAPLR